MAFFVAICALAIAFVTALLKLRRVESENQKLREIAGYSARTTEGDRWNLMACGWQDYGDEASAHHGSLFLRVDRHDKYKLRLVHYNGVFKRRIVHETDLNDPLVAITCVPSSTHKAFEVQSTDSDQPKTRLSYRCTIPGWRMSFNPRGGSNLIDNEDCMLRYWFYSDSKVEGPNASEPEESEADIIALCDKYKIQSIFFQIVPR